MRGRLASDPDDSVYLKSINGGGNAALAVLDFGVGGPLASVVYDANANNGTAMGGIFGYLGGRAYNIDYFQGTNLGDTFTIVGATARSFIYDGRLGNDTVNGGAGVDNVTGGGGVDTLRGNAGNDILNGGTEGDIIYGGLGNDSLTGGAGNDFFFFNTALNASTNKDSISRLQRGAGHVPPGECDLHQACRGWWAQSRLLQGRRGGNRCQRLHRLQQDDGRAVLRQQRQRGRRSDPVRDAAQQAGAHQRRLPGDLIAIDRGPAAMPAGPFAPTSRRWSSGTFQVNIRWA